MKWRTKKTPPGGTWNAIEEAAPIEMRYEHISKAGAYRGARPHIALHYHELRINDKFP